MVSSGRTEQADIECQQSAYRVLREIQSNRSLVLDDRYEIMREYQMALMGSSASDPGPGEGFFIWASGTESVHRVQLTPHPDRGYLEFPSTPELASFDWDDRKFVAATIKSGTDRTELVNATDSDYKEHDQALREAGVDVREICPHILT